MFRSGGYFRGINCPFFASGLCERPHCHYRHVKLDDQEEKAVSKCQISVTGPSSSSQSSTYLDKLSDGEFPLTSNSLRNKNGSGEKHTQDEDNQQAFNKYTGEPISNTTVLYNKYTGEPITNTRNDYPKQEEEQKTFVVNKYTGELQVTGNNHEEYLVTSGSVNKYTGKPERLSGDPDQNDIPDSNIQGKKWKDLLGISVPTYNPTPLAELQKRKSDPSLNKYSLSSSSTSLSNQEYDPELNYSTKSSVSHTLPVRQVSDRPSSYVNKRSVSYDPSNPHYRQPVKKQRKLSLQSQEATFSSDSDNEEKQDNASTDLKDDNKYSLKDANFFEKLLAGNKFGDDDDTQHSVDSDKESNPLVATKDNIFERLQSHSQNDANESDDSLDSLDSLEGDTPVIKSTKMGIKKKKEHILKEKIKEKFVTNTPKSVTKVKEDLKSVESKSKHSAKSMESMSKSESHKIAESKHDAKSAESKAKHNTKSAESTAKHNTKSAESTAKHNTKSAESKAKHNTKSADSKAKHDTKSAELKEKHNTKSAVSKTKHDTKNIGESKHNAKISETKLKHAEKNHSDKYRSRSSNGSSSAHSNFSSSSGSNHTESSKSQNGISTKCNNTNHSASEHSSSHSSANNKSSKHGHLSSHKEKSSHSSTSHKKSTGSSSNKSKSEDSKSHNKNNVKSSHSSHKSTDHSKHERSKSVSKEKQDSAKGKAEKNRRNSSELQKKKIVDINVDLFGADSDESSNDNFEEDFGLLSDEEFSEEDRYEECLRIFEENKKSPIKMNSNKKFKKDNAAAPESQIGKQRVAHKAETEVKRKVPEKAPTKLSPAEVMHNRFLELQRRAREEAAESQTAASSASGKQRTAHQASSSKSRNPFTTSKKSSTQSQQKLTIVTASRTEKRKAHMPTTIQENLARPTIPTEFGSKVPSNIRQRYLNLIIDECLKLCQSQKDAYERGQEEESSVYKRATSKTIYLNVAVNTIKRLRTELSEKSPSNSKKAKLSGALSLSHEAVLGGKNAKMTTYTVNRSGGGHKLPQENFKGAELYKRLSPYILTEQQLRENGFPRDCPDNIGNAIFYTESRHKVNSAKLKHTNYEKLCVRCGKVFIVYPNGTYERQEECTFHWGKAWKKKIAGFIDTRYTCCQGDLSSEGCQVAKAHAHENNKWENLTGYMKTLPCSPPIDGDYGVFAMDCEMVYTKAGVELARVTVTDPENECVYETLVKPDRPVIDYNTRFSGLTELDLQGVTTSLRDVQAVLLSLFSDKTIVMGHSLESDLAAVRMIHNTVVDTSVVYPHRLGPPYKRALKNLMAEYLKKIIQDDVGGHDSKEDATSCMELMHLKIKEDYRRKT